MVTSTIFNFIFVINSITSPMYNCCCYCYTFRQRAAGRQFYTISHLLASLFRIYSLIGTEYLPNCFDLDNEEFSRKAIEFQFKLIVANSFIIYL